MVQCFYVSVVTLCLQIFPYAFKGDKILCSLICKSKDEKKLMFCDAMCLILKSTITGTVFSRESITLQCLVYIVAISLLACIKNRKTWQIWKALHSKNELWPFQMFLENYTVVQSWWMYLRLQKWWRLFFFNLHAVISLNMKICSHGGQWTWQKIVQLYPQSPLVTTAGKNW